MIIKSHKSNDSQTNKDKNTNNDLRNTLHETKGSATRTSLKPG